ncbi:MAG TPA: methyltransferase domain-containing protein [Steroidobacteraceae bacterium]|nr:methyltransferase domain-containing protein [Steroidobacteraceae bacterium]
MARRIRQYLLSGAAALLAACATGPATPPAIHTPAGPPRDAVTAAAIEKAVAGEHRSAENRARDASRHPVDTLLFFGIKPDMTVVEVWPGAGGWYTEILAPLLAERGKLYTAMMPPAPGNEYVTASLAQFDAKLAARPDLYGKVTVTRLGAGDFNIAPPGSADLVVTFRNVHNWMDLGIAKEAFAEMYRALKPGGVLGVVEHRGAADKPQDPRADSGYVTERFAIDLVTSAGFVLEARSEINANPRDTKDYEQGVWALPPTYRAGSRDRAKYEAIGESDRMTLRFRKPR